MQSLQSAARLWDKTFSSFPQVYPVSLLPSPIQWSICEASVFVSHAHNKLQQCTALTVIVQYHVSDECRVDFSPHDITGFFTKHGPVEIMLLFHCWQSCTCCLHHIHWGWYVNQWGTESLITFVHCFGSCEKIKNAINMMMVCVLCNYGKGL